LGQSSNPISHGNVKVSIGYSASNLLVDDFDPQIFLYKL